MTVRDRLNRRIFPARTAMLVFVVLFGISLAMIQAGREWHFVAVFCLACIVAIRLFLYLGVSCPQCEKGLSSLTCLTGGSSKLSKDLRFCPFCGLSLDEVDT